MTQHIKVIIADILLGKSGCRRAIWHHTRSAKSQTSHRTNEDRLVPAASCCDSESVIAASKAGVSAVRGVVGVEAKVESAVVSRKAAVVDA